MKLPNFTGVLLLSASTIAVYACTSDLNDAPVTHDDAATSPISVQNNSLDSLPVSFQFDDVSPLFIGEYRLARVEIPSDASFDFQDLDFVIKDNASSGNKISKAPTDNKAPPRPSEITICAGEVPGVFTIEAIQRQTSALVGKTTFAVTRDWPHAKTRGPGLWFEGSRSSTPSPLDGKPLPLPAGIRPKSTTGPYKVAVILIETDDQAFNHSDLSIIKKHLSKEIFTGSPCPDSPKKSCSTAVFLDELSYGNFSLEGTDKDIYGPFPVPSRYTDQYFRHFSAWYWTTTPAFEAASISVAAENGVPISKYDSVIIATQSSPTAAVWASASGGVTLVKTEAGYKWMGIVSVDANHAQPGTNDEDNARRQHALIAHELLHNLGLGDQRVADGTSPYKLRQLGHWSLMDMDIRRPHLTAIEKRMLDWLDDGYVETIRADHSKRSYILASERKPSSNYKSLIEIVTAFGDSLAFEYRNPHPDHIGDLYLPEPTGAILPLDLNVRPTRRGRPQILTAMAAQGDVYDRPDFPPASGPGKAIKVGQSKLFGGTPDAPIAVTALFDNINHGFATVDLDVSYPTGRADPFINPMLRDGTAQSPDIFVRNERSKRDPRYENTTWPGHENYIITVISNGGTATANNVWVNIYIKNLSLMPPNAQVPPFRTIPVVPIPAGASQPLLTTWIPEEAGYYSITVEIAPHFDHLGTPELSHANNIAHSHYIAAESSTASPWSRAVVPYTLTNAGSTASLFELVAVQSNPLYRTFVSHRWVVLDPGESHSASIMSEFNGDGFLADGGNPNTHQDFLNVPNEISMLEFETDLSTGVRELVREGTLRVKQGLRTELMAAIRSETSGSVLEGTVRVSRDGSLAPDNYIIVQTEDSAGERTDHPISSTSGKFRFPLSNVGWRRVRAYYLAPSGHTDSECDWLTITGRD